MATPASYASPAQPGRRLFRLLRWLPTLLLLPGWLLSPLQPSIDDRVRLAAAPMAFRLLDWETTRLGSHLGRLADGLAPPRPPEVADAAAVRVYLEAELGQQGRYRVAAEAALERLLNRTLFDLGARGPWPPIGDRLFPPVLLAISAPPNVLVVSPRTELRVQQSVLLTTDLTEVQVTSLENSTETLGVSALVSPIGGLATYPAMVLDTTDPHRLVSASVHEWVHQYFAFTPLGSRYWARQEAREINETAADLVGEEVSREVLSRWPIQPAPVAPTAPPAPPPSFDFRAFMRATRLEVERLLAAGRVDEAEAYMRVQQVELQRNGFAIRRLNQAYFAFNGSYGEGAAASPENPIPPLLRQVRSESASLGAFLERVAGVTSVAELRVAAVPARLSAPRSRQAPDTAPAPAVLRDSPSG